MPKFLSLLCLSLAPLSAPAASIVVIGDSISAGFGIEVGAGWVDLLRIKIEQAGRDDRVINASISGDTSAGGVARIDGVLNRHQPDVVIIELGANDGLRGLPPGQMKANLNEMIVRAKRRGANVLLLGMRIPPNYGKRYTEMFYDVYRQLAKEHAIAFVPFLLEDVALEKSLMQKDGMHPNENAQPAIAQLVWKQLKPLLSDAAQPLNR